VILFLKIGRKVSGHLSYAIAGCISDTAMLFRSSFFLM
jgi:hypothetical protein